MLLDNNDIQQVDEYDTTDPLAIIDSGTSKNYLKVNSPVVNLREVNDGANVTLPNSQSIRATHRAEIPVALLSKAARTSEIFPGLTQYSLISTGQLCDDGCTVNFNNNTSLSKRIVKPS